MHHNRLRDLAAFGLLLAPAVAQCPTGSTLVAGGQFPAPSGPVYAMAKWDPDGPGPLGEHIVCGGDFAYAGASATANIALLNPTTRIWSAVGSGFNAPVFALAVSPSGTLTAAGDFAQSGTTAVARVAQWNGTSWLPLGSGTDGQVLAAAFTPNGDLFVGGVFATAGGIPASNIARWNGTTWSALGSGISGVQPSQVPMPVPVLVSHLGVRSNGDVIVGGSFANAGGLNARGLARWNGAWSTFGVVPPNTPSQMVTAMVVLANDDVVLCTFGLQSPFNNNVMRWNGVTWTPLGPYPSDSWRAFAELPNGTLVGQREVGSVFRLASWTGSAWAPMTGPDLYVGATSLLTAGSNEIWMSGFGLAGMTTMWHFDGQTWRAPASGLNGEVTAAAGFGDGFAIAGYFSQVGNAATGSIAVRQNGAWATIGAPIDGVIRRLWAQSNGDLLVSGYFTIPSAPGIQNVARWDGQQWRPMPGLPTTPGTTINSFAESPSGVVYAAGPGPFAARWNGTSWQQLGVLPSNAWANAIAVMANGDPVVALDVFGPNILRWNGTSWTPLGNGLPVSTQFETGVASLCVLPNGDLVAAGWFDYGPGQLVNVARWDGVSWQAMGNGLPAAVTDLDLLPNGDLLATHRSYDDFGQPVAASPSRWNGTAWTTVPGIGTTPYQGVWQSAVNDRGEVLLVGNFQTANGVVAGGLASLLTNCPTNRQPVGAGCVGSAGPVTSTVVAEAWLGGTWRANVTNLPAASIAVHVFGLASLTLPLAGVLPAALPGCTLHVSPDLLLADLPVAGTSTTSWSIPPQPSLLAQTFRHQAVPFELGPGFVFTAVTASNAWQMTIGAW
jgi:trimeric autotransporter adhesin